MKKNHFVIQHENVFAVPILHYKMELAAQVKLAFDFIQPDCVAVELPESLQLEFLHAASRLPDISVVVTEEEKGERLYTLCEPCDATFEALRSALEHQIPAFCIDLDVSNYPDFYDHLPDPYAIEFLGLETYYNCYLAAQQEQSKHALDQKRELYMSRRLKELSLQYDRILFVTGFHHLQAVLNHINDSSFPPTAPALPTYRQLFALTDESARDVMAEWGWISLAYENCRAGGAEKDFPPDRQKLIYQLYRQSGAIYQEKEAPFPSYNLRNLMKFTRNYALLKGHLLPDLYQIITAAKSCVNHNYAYETWQLATSYPLKKNIDNLPELNVRIEDIWGKSKLIHFHLRQKPRKSKEMQLRRKDKSHFHFQPPSPFGICSYPPEDVTVENFGEFVKKKGLGAFERAGRKNHSLYDGARGWNRCERDH